MKNERAAVDLEGWLIDQFLGMEVGLKPEEVYQIYRRGQRFATVFPHAVKSGTMRHHQMSKGPLILVTDREGAIYLRRQRKDFRAFPRVLNIDELA